jgi:hypothetical protein
MLMLVIRELSQPDALVRVRSDPRHGHRTYQDIIDQIEHIYNILEDRQETRELQKDRQQMPRQQRFRGR